MERVENMDNRKEAVQTIDLVLKDVMKSDDKVLKQVKNLEMILLNLKIESARIRDGKTIIPIADRLEQVTREIERAIKELIENDRRKANEAIKTLMEE